MASDEKPTGGSDRRSRDRVADDARSGCGSSSALSRLKMLERRFGEIFRVRRSVDPELWPIRSERPTDD